MPSAGKDVEEPEISSVMGGIAVLGPPWRAVWLENSNRRQLYNPAMPQCLPRETGTRMPSVQSSHVPVSTREKQEHMPPETRHTCSSSSVCNDHKPEASQWPPVGDGGADGLTQTRTTARRQEGANNWIKLQCGGISKHFTQKAE